MMTARTPTKRKKKSAKKTAAKPSRNGSSARKSRKTRTEGNLGSVSARIEAVKDKMFDANGWLCDLSDRRCEAIINAGFRPDSLPVVFAMVEVLTEERPVTTRGLLYRLVSLGWLPDTTRTSYNVVKRRTKTLREKFVIPFTWIVDGVRDDVKPSSWEGLGPFVDRCRELYRRDFWSSLPDYVHVIVEKHAIAGVIQPVTIEYDVHLSPIRGDSSISYAHRIATRWKQIPKPVHVYYLGDWDPKGLGIEKELRRKLARYSGRLDWHYRDDYEDGFRIKFKDYSDDDRAFFNEPPGVMIWRRLAVVETDFVAFDLRPLTCKPKDQSAPKFIARHGNRCAELDAIPADVLRERVRDAIESHVDSSEWQRLKNIEASELESFTTFMAAFRPPSDAA